MSQFQDLYDRVLSDAGFRTYLGNNPSGALQSIGITPTDDLLAAVNSVIDAVREVGEDLGADDGLIGTVPFAT
jgi:hypothetical protein